MVKKRQKFNLGNSFYFTGKPGKIIPIYWKFVNPGDSFLFSSTILNRFAPMVAPTMTPVHAKIHWWFVSLDDLWDEFYDFITGGPDGQSMPTVPFINVKSEPSSLADYLGVSPVNTGTAGEPSYQSQKVNALPFRAYDFIYNRRYKDEDLQEDVGFDTASGEDKTTNTTLLSSNWPKDRFTMARASTQKGSEVIIPFAGDGAPVVGNGLPLGLASSGLYGSRSLTSIGVETAHYLFGRSSDVYSSDNLPPSLPSKSSGVESVDDFTNYGVTKNPNLSGLVLSKGAGIDPIDLRTAEVYQHLEEMMMLFGNRYSEYLRWMYGVKPADGRIHEPEYLGGADSTIQFSEVLQTAQDGVSPVGTLRGHGIGAMRSKKRMRYFDEHGIIMAFYIVQPISIYGNGTLREFYYEDRFDFFTPQLQYTGMSPIYNGEVYAGASDPKGTFGYNFPYDEYRHTESRIAGEFRTTEDAWTMARMFEHEPVLNGDFITSNPTDRIFAAKEDLVDPLRCMCINDVRARRVMVHNPVPRLRF